VPARRAPQQPRSIDTRARLVGAAAAVLVEYGFQGASTSAVAAGAGVSQGALFKHFPTKSDLLAACVEALLAGYVVDFRDDMARRLAMIGGAALAANGPRERVRPAVASLWGIFRRPGMRAVFEVYVAARTDAALAAQLAPILERHRAAILAEAARLLPELAAAPDEAAFAIDAVVYAMQGAALGVFAPDARAEAEQVAFFTRLAEHELERALAAARTR
jgi:AcrR family transcriptional regulator